ncbi:MAG: RHS repeat-associated core domain-containing protein [Terriglobia bacterium]
MASGVAGYRLYVVEKPVDQNGNPWLFDYESWRYHATRPVPYVTLGAGERSYRLTGLSRCQGIDYSGSNCVQRNSLTFRVASVDLHGQVSDPSVPSNPVSPSAPADLIPAPASLKAVIWTVSDATRSELQKAQNLANTIYTTPNPRELNGIKLTWLTGPHTDLTGYRVYRTTTPGTGYCALVRTPVGAGLTACPGDRNSGSHAAFSDTLTTGPTGGNHVFVDLTAQQGITYYYVVRAVTSAGESPFSPEVAGLAMEHVPQPLSPPRYFKAWAPDPRDNTEINGVYLRWCPNPQAEGVTGYKVYRGVDNNLPQGPFQPLVTIPPECLEGSRRCEIRWVTPGNPAAGVTLIQATAPSCSVGIDRNCRIIDLTVAQPLDGVTANIYNYVVTALRGAEESGFSIQNEAWPNYTQGNSCGSNPLGNPRFDPDNFPDVFCGDEISSLSQETPLALASSAPAVPGSEAEVCTVGDDPSASGGLAPYRTIAGPPIICQDCDGGGGGGGAPPPTPNAVPRIVYYHLDHLGSPRVILNTAGQVVSKHHYMPFGEEAPTVAMDSSNKRHFTGHERDSETGLDYMMARYYSSSLARFMAVDPGNDTGLEDPQSWNVYAYVRNNPMRGTDPTGMAVDWGDISLNSAEHRTSQYTGEEDTLGRMFAEGWARYGPGGSGDPEAEKETSDPEEVAYSQSTGPTHLGWAKLIPWKNIGPWIKKSWPKIKKWFERVPKRSLENPQSLRGAKPGEIEKLIPDGWVRQPTVGEGGTRWLNPKKPGEAIRVMPGNPADPNPIKRGPYMRISRDRKVSDPIPLAGNPTLQ